jgi:hypothetical protein
MFKNEIANLRRKSLEAKRAQEMRKAHKHNEELIAQFRKEQKKVA